MLSQLGNIWCIPPIQIVIDYIAFVSSPSTLVIDALKRLASFNFKDIGIDGNINFLQELVSFIKEVKVFFKVPNQQMISHISPTPNPNQIFAAFINFLLQMVEVILRFDPDFIACVYGSIQILRTELGFLIAFLGDTAMHLQPTTNILIDIEAVVNEVGNLFYPFFVTALAFHLITEGEEMTDMEAVVNKIRSFLHSDSSDFVEEAKNTLTDIKDLVNELGSFLVPDIGILDLALSDLLPKFDLLIPKIKEHCIRLSNMPTDMAPNTALVSLFIFDSVLVDLMYLINNKSDRIVGVNDQIVMLHEELMLLGSSVTDIAVQQEAGHEDILIRAVDIAYEAEYVINSFPPVWYLTLRLPQLIEKIQLIRMSILDIKNKIDVAGVPEVSKYPGEQASLQSKEPPILEDIVVGFDNMEIEIAEQLVKGTHRLQIISIYGMPGIGKTTLANKVYNNPSVVNHFYKRAWCVVSQTYNKKHVLIDILSSMRNLKGEKNVNMDDESLAEDLYKSLKGMRYLIVMDDIWDTKVWDDLKRYFPDDRNGSRILFTTRNNEVGLEASPFIIALPFLSEDECWELLQRKVFQDKNCPQELLDIGKQIAANCRGLPLAVVVIAGVLANMEKVLWQKFAKNLSSRKSQTTEKIYQILELSYKHLPLHLRPCFLYFGAFKEDMEIPVRKLISLWVAQGFVKKEERKSLEDVALGYLMKLIDRSLILVGKRRLDGGVKTCKIHDLLREICSRIGEENNFLKVVKVYGYDDPLKSFGQVSMFQQHHHLSINYDYNPIHSPPFGLHVRSLLCFDLVSPTLISCSFKVVRVLDSFEISYDHVVIGIEHLVHLRYLKISGILPPMESFHRLECLVVHSMDEMEIPDILLNMLSLRHMHFLGGGYFSASCLQQVTNDESFKINNLQSISVLKISDETNLKILRCSPNLHRLKVRIRSSLNYSFAFLNQLESLKLESDDLSSSLFSLPLNLKQLTLAQAHMSPEQMEIIGKLEYLEVLKLKRIAFEGEQWDTSEGGFPQLKFLKLFRVQIVEWNAASDHFPRLQQLVLEFCKSLNIPPNLGDFPTLQMIEVYKCAKAIEYQARQIQEEQTEH
ncbi:Disease resistance protein RPP13 [Forsythia ovata]|uniref:Disease resistance protein RPP13 n=1 Tax=Forsythia ovata TaxID=205694 RepID=A0ABD1WPJ3_9LAMI